MALIMLTISAKPADKEHEYGHTKAEYFRVQSKEPSSFLLP